jgi:uncharacterized DUF497 family protein
VANPIEDCTGFDWDESNVQKNWQRHRVLPEEAEDVFFNDPLVLRSDIRHSGRERRFYALGQTSAGRKMFVAFTVPRALIRVISAREMNRYEPERYKKHEEDSEV